MQTHKSYQSSLIESLEDPQEAAAYLEAVLEDGTSEEISLALSNVAEARRNAESKLNTVEADWERCYQLLTTAEIPALPTLVSLLNGLGLRLSITVKEEQSA